MDRILETSTLIQPKLTYTITTNYQKYVKNLKLLMVAARSLLAIDQIEARAIKTRTACTSIYELSDMMKSMAKEGTTEKFMVIIEASLITKRRAEEV